MPVGPEFRKRACQNLQRLSQSSLLAYIPSSNFLHDVDRSEWQVTSFDPQRREACVTITTDSGIRVVSYTLASITTYSSFD